MERPPAHQLVSRAACSWLNVVVLAAAVGLAAVTGQPGLLFAAAVLYGLLVVADACSPRFWRRLADRESRRLREIPETSSLSEESLRVVAYSLRSGYRDIVRALKRTPDPIRAHVRVALSTLQELRGHAAQLLRNADELNRYLLATSRGALEREIKQLKEARLEQADAAARAEYQKALTIREEQLSAHERIKREYDRLLASLQVIVATVESFPSRLHRLRLLDTSARQDVVGEAREQLARIDVDVSASQRLLEELVRAPDELLASSAETTR